MSKNKSQPQQQTPTQTDGELSPVESIRKEGQDIFARAMQEIDQLGLKLDIVSEIESTGLGRTTLRHIVVVNFK